MRDGEGWVERSGTWDKSGGVLRLLAVGRAGLPSARHVFPTSEFVPLLPPRNFLQDRDDLWLVLLHLYLFFLCPKQC